MDFFRRLISQYPEFDDMISAIEQMQMGDIQVIDGLTQGFGSNFEKFYSKQPVQVSKAMKPINKSIENEVKILQDSFATLSVLPKDLQFLKSQHAGIQKIREAYMKIQESARKAREAADKAKQNMEAQPNDSPQRAKAEAVYNAALQKEKEEDEKAKSIETEYNESLDQYQAHFIDSLSSTLAAVANQRAEVAAQQRQIAQEIATAIESIEYYQDRDIPKLKQQLNDLDYEIVD